MFRKEPQGDQVVRLPTAHRLAEKKRAGSARGFPFQAIESLRQEDAHTFGHVVLGEKVIGVNGGQIVQIVNRVQAGLVKNRSPGFAQIRDCFH